MSKAKGRYVQIHEATADPHIVRLFTDHLIAAFEEFVNEYPGTVDYVDGFMAAHNLHKAIVANLAEQTGTPVWWDMAAGMFQEAVEREKGEAA